jgi:hypothetical protein
VPPRDPFPRCGSTSSTHRFRTCRACNAIYNKGWRAKRIPPAPTCALCGRRRGDGPPVFRYSLSRSIKLKTGWAMRNLASLTLCDPCIQTRARPSRNYTRRLGLRLGSWTEKE